EAEDGRQALLERARDGREEDVRGRAAGARDDDDSRKFDLRVDSARHPVGRRGAEEDEEHGREPDDDRVAAEERERAHFASTNAVPSSRPSTWSIARRSAAVAPPVTSKRVASRQPTLTA